MRILRYIDRFLAEVAIVLIRVYQYTLSPDKGLPSLWLKGRICVHEPHCSQYSINVFRRYGFFRGLFRSMDRVAHCTGGTKKIYDPDHYKVVFFSSAPIGVSFLQALSEDNRFDVVGVVTMPDAASGRGMKMKENIIKAEGEKIDPECSDFVVTTKKINPDKSDEGRKFAEWLESKEPDFLVVIAYGKIIPQSILDIVKIAPINIHGSLLPKYRGASPIQSVFLHHERETGITIMKMDASMDTGDMIEKLKFKIPFDWTVKDVIEKMKDVGPSYLTDTLWKYGKKIFGEVKQKESDAVYCDKIKKEDGLIDPWKDSIFDIYAKYRGYYLWPKIYFRMQNSDGRTQEFRVVIEEMKLDEKDFDEDKKSPLIDENNSLHKSVKRLIVKPEGKRAMDWNAFVNGYFS